jgi:hypothetical protein
VFLLGFILGYFFTLHLVTLPVRKGRGDSRNNVFRLLQIIDVHMRRGGTILSNRIFYFLWPMLSAKGSTSKLANDQGAVEPANKVTEKE